MLRRVVRSELESKHITGRLIIGVPFLSLVCSCVGRYLFLTDKNHHYDSLGGASQRRHNVTIVDSALGAACSTLRWWCTMPAVSFSL